MTVIIFVGGLICLIGGAEALVKGASRLATAMGISPLVVGLTVVALGTSSPEIAVGVKAALEGQASIAVGNVIGSNIFNVLFILGLSAMIAPLVVSSRLVKLDVPLMIGVSLLVFFFSWDQWLTGMEGGVLVVGLLIYIGFMIHQSLKHAGGAMQHKEEDIEVPEDFAVKDWIINLSFIVGGLLLLVIGSRWLVSSAVSFATYLGISELIVGLTIIAVGTSLPEVVTSLVAAFRGNRDIAVGNVVGSNLFNLMGVLGIAGIVAPTHIQISESVISFDLPVMIAVAFACLPIFFTGGQIGRWEGVILFGYYIVYTTYLILAATHHNALEGVNLLMLYFVLPITAITLFAITYQEIRN